MVLNLLKEFMDGLHFTFEENCMLLLLNYIFITKDLLNLLIKCYVGWGKRKFEVQITNKQYGIF